MTEELESLKDENTESEMNEVEELPPVTEAKKSKGAVADALLRETKTMLEKTEAEGLDCQIILEHDLKAYTTVRDSFREKYLERAKSLLLSLGMLSEEEREPKELSEPFEAQEALLPLELKEIRSGKVSGFFYGLLAGVSAVGAFGYWVSRQTPLSFSMDKLTSGETIKELFGWIAKAIGQPEELFNGGLLLSFGMLAIMGLVYTIYVTLRTSNNLRFVEAQLEETKAYVKQKEACKSEMEKVDLHINSAIETLKDYEVLLDEQIGSLQRVMHFEGIQETQDAYQKQSREKISETLALIEEIEAFISIKMSHEGRLSEASVDHLAHTQEFLKEFLEKFSR